MPPDNSHLRKSVEIVRWETGQLYICGFILIVMTGLFIFEVTDKNGNSPIVFTSLAVIGTVIKIFRRQRHLKIIRHSYHSKVMI